MSPPPTHTRQMKSWIDCYHTCRHPSLHSLASPKLGCTLEIFVVADLAPCFYVCIPCILRHLDPTYLAHHVHLLDYTHGKRWRWRWWWWWRRWWWPSPPPGVPPFKKGARTALKWCVIGTRGAKGRNIVKHCAFVHVGMRIWPWGCPDLVQNSDLIWVSASARRLILSMNMHWVNAPT
jgi:hypothetical protein